MLDKSIIPLIALGGEKPGQESEKNKIVKVKRSFIFPLKMALLCNLSEFLEKIFKYKGSL